MKHEVEGDYKLIYCMAGNCQWMLLLLLVDVALWDSLCGNQQNTHNVSLSFVLECIFISVTGNSDLPKNTSMGSGLLMWVFYLRNIMGLNTYKTRSITQLNVNVLGFSCAQNAHLKQCYLFQKYLELSLRAVFMKEREEWWSTLSCLSAMGSWQGG
jgi:hypothetical protein